MSKNFHRREVLRILGPGMVGTFLIAAGCERYTQPPLLQIENPSHFPYPFSPWERYATLEEALLQEFNIPTDAFLRQSKRIIQTGDALADQVAETLLDQQHTRDIQKASQGMDRAEYMKTIAQKMTEAGLFYTEESLLTRSFDPRIHEKGQAHLDCDLIAYLMCHIGRKHDVEMYLIEGPLHAYLWVPIPGSKDQGYMIEPTEFRKIETRGSVMDLAGQGIGEYFFTTPERQREHGGIRTTPEFEKVAKLHAMVTDPKRIEDNILVNILTGLDQYAEQNQDLGLRLKLYKKMAAAVGRGTDSYLLVTNLFVNSLELATQTMDLQRFQEADYLLQWAEWIRTNKGTILIYEEPIEKIQRGELQWATGQTEKARQTLEQTRLFYDQNEGPINGPYGYQARNRYHAELLTLSAQIEFRTGQLPSSSIHDMAVLAQNYYNLKDPTHPNQEILKGILSQTDLSPTYHER